MKKCKTCIYKDLLPIADPCFSCTKDIQDGYERDCSEEMCEKCVTCKNVIKYQDEEPCKSCSPATDAKGWESGKTQFMVNYMVKDTVFGAYLTTGIVTDTAYSIAVREYKVLQKRYATDKVLAAKITVVAIKLSIVDDKIVSGDTEVFNENALVSE